MSDLRSRIALPANRGSVRLGFLSLIIAIPAAYMVFHKCASFLPTRNSHRYAFFWSFLKSNPMKYVDVEAKKIEKEEYYKELEDEVIVRLFCVSLFGG